MRLTSGPREVLPRNHSLLAPARLGLVAALLGLATPQAPAAFLYATGQALIENDPGTHDDVRENRVYRIDTVTGLATPVSPATSGLPAALGGAPDGRLLGFDGRLGEIDPTGGVFTPIGPPTGLSATAFDVTADGRGFAVTNSGARRLHRIDLASGAATPVGPEDAIGDAIDSAFGLAPGTSQPFLISLGSVVGTLYGINLESGRINLIAIDPDTGVASVLGPPNAVGGAFGGRYSGFSALTGVDEDADGRFDSLFGSVNFDAGARLGGVARFDLATGEFSLVGTNPGVIFFGFGSAPAAVPEPGGLACLGIGLLGLGLRGWILRNGRGTGPRGGEG
jgi:hypothetical protein